MRIIDKETFRACFPVLRNSAKVLLISFAVASLALAQSSPNLQPGQIPTAAQWNSYFAAKTDYVPGGLPVARGGTGATDAATARLNLGISSPADLATALPSGSTSTLYGGTGGAGTARVITLGTGLSMAGSTLNSTASGTGTVTNVSGVNANGFTVSVANGTTTPAITVATSATGVLKGTAGVVATATNADLPAMSSTVGGAVPTPPNNTTQYLRADGTWNTPAGTGSGTVTSFAFSNNNGFLGIVSNPTTTPSLTISTGLSGVLVGTGSGMRAGINSDLPAMTATVGGAVPIPPNNVIKFLRGDGTWANALTSTSVVTANGFAGSVANSTTAPAITLTTTISGVVKGSASALAAAVSGTDFAPGTSGLATGIVKSTTTTGTLSIATGADLPAMSSTVGGAVPTPPNDVTKFLAGNGTWQTGSGGSGISGLTASGQALSYAKAVSGNAAVFTGTLAGTLLTVTSFSGSRPLIVGDVVVGSGVNNGSQIIAIVTGSGGNGTYTMSQSQSVGPEAMSVPNYDQVALIVQNDNPGMFSSVNSTYGSTGSPLNFSQININGSYVYPAAAMNNGFGGFLNFITRNLAGTSVQGAFVNGGLIGTTAGAELGDLDLGIYGAAHPGCNGSGINVPRVIGLRTDAGRLHLAVDCDGDWDIADNTNRFGSGYFRGFLTSAGSQTEVVYPAGFSASAARFSRTSPSGGSGTVRAASFVGSTTDAGSASFEWNQLAYLNNFAAAGENVAFYGQAYKRSTGATWAGVFDAQDSSCPSPCTGDPVNALYGLEVDVTANGTDSGARRFGIQVVGYRGAGGAAAQIANGIWVGPAGSPGDVTFVSGINVATSGYLGLNLSGAYTGAAISVNNPAGTPTIIDASAAGNIGALLNVGSSNSIWSGSSLGSYAGKIAVKVDGATKWVAVYN